MEEKKKPIKNAFCANEQAITPHEVSLEINGELLLTCGCGRFIKFPVGLEASGIDEYLKKHEEHNTGQVSIEAQEKIIEDLIKAEETDIEPAE